MADEEGVRILVVDDEVGLCRGLQRILQRAGHTARIATDGSIAADIVADEMGPDELASLGLLPPRVRISVEDRAVPEEQRQVLAEIAIGRLDATRGLFSQRIGEPTVFVLPPSAVESIPHSLASFVRDFEASPDDGAPGGAELDPGVLEADPLEGEQFP